MKLTKTSDEVLAEAAAATDPAEAERLLAAALRIDGLERRRAALRQRQVEAKEQQAAKRQAKLDRRDEKLAAKHGLTVEEIRAGRAVEATRKRRRLWVGIGI